MKEPTQKHIPLTPWRLRERTRGFRQDLAKTIQSNFFYSFLFLPPPKRRAIINVYSFCRAVDDVVDEFSDSKGNPWSELATWRAEIDACYAGKPTRTVTRRLRDTLDSYPMPKEYFVELIKGCEMDLLTHRYETFEELYQYCYRVASITGLMCIEIFGYRAPETREYAIKLGVALQLTNILRDLKEDASRGRVYLPQEDLRKFGYSEDALVNGIVDDRFRALMRFECERARRYYVEAAEHLPATDRPTLIAAITMGRIYYRLLRQIERRNYDVFNHRIRLHRPERLLIALGEWFRAQVRAPGISSRR